MEHPAGVRNGLFGRLPGPRCGSFVGRVLRRSVAIVLGLAGGVVLSLALLWAAGIAPNRVLLPILGPLGARVHHIHVLDDTIGYVLDPGASFRHREASFDVEYHVDDAGSRRVPGFDPDRPRVLVLGDSWTFGHGVEDGRSSVRSRTRGTSSSYSTAGRPSTSLRRIFALRRVGTDPRRDRAHARAHDGPGRALRRRAAPGPDTIAVFGERSRSMRRRMRRAGQDVVDLQGDPAFPKTDDLFFPNDGHPTPRWNALVADAIAARLDPPVAHR